MRFGLFLPLHMVASTVPSLSWAERAKKAQVSLPVLDHSPLSDLTPTEVPTKPPSVNFWDVRKEQRAAAAARSSTQPLHSPPIPLLSPDPDDDPFVVRVPPNRDRHPITVPTLDDSDAWPEVGKSSAPAVKPNKEKEDHERGEVSHSSGPTASKKSACVPSLPYIIVSPPHSLLVVGEKKWIPLPAEEWQTTTDHNRPRPHSIKNGHSHHPTKTMPVTNGGNPSTSQSRAQSGHNSVSQSRINSRSGSVQSSPRIPRNKRLPPDESGIATPPDSNLPINIPLVLHPQPDLHALPSSVGSFALQCQLSL
jgi:la-related protein 1